MGKSEDKKELTKEVEMNEHTDTIPQVEAQEISFKFFITPKNESLKCHSRLEFKNIFFYGCVILEKLRWSFLKLSKV